MMELKAGPMLGMGYIEPNKKMVELMKEVLRQNNSVLEMNKRIILYLGVSAIVAKEVK